MAKLTNLNLNAFSIVRGDDVQPANPGAVALVYKAQPKPKEQNTVAKETKTGTAPINKQSRVAAITKAVGEIMKAGWTETSTYSSQSSTSVQQQEDPAQAGGEAPIVVVIEQSAEKTEVPPVIEVAADDTEDVTKALNAVLKPVTEAITKFDSRLAVIEKQSTGSRQIEKGYMPGAQVGGGSEKFSEFTKFLSDKSGLTAGQKLSKATITTSGWSYGLSFVEGGNFIDYIVDQSVALKQCRTVKMPNAKMVIDKIGLGGNVLVKGTPGTDPGDTVSISGPTQVALVAEEVLAIVSIGDDTLEDNIEGDAFVQHLLGMIGRSASNELEAAAMMGDTSVSDAGIMDRFDGWYKLAKAAGAHVVEGMADANRKWPGTSADGTGVGWKMTKLLKAIPTKYWQDPSMMRNIINSLLYLDYNDAIAALNYANAFASVAGQTDLPIRGISHLKMPLLTTTQGFTYTSTPHTDGTFCMVTNMKNLIFGIHREIKIEPFRQPRKRCTDYVLSMRAVPAIENGDAIGIYDHLQLQ